MTMRPEPEPVHTHKPKDANGQPSLSRWIGKISVWCITRTASSPIEWTNVRRPMGPQRATELNALPGRILEDFRDHERRNPTDAEIFERYVERLALLGHHWSADTESVRTSDPLETAKLLATSTAREVQHRRDHLDQHEYELDDHEYEPDDRDSCPSMELNDEDWYDDFTWEWDAPARHHTREVSFGSEWYTSVGSPEPGDDRRRAVDMDSAGERQTTGRSGSRRSEPALVHIGTVGERITVSGTVVTTGWVQSYRWEPRTLLIVDCGTAHVKMITSARWAHNVRRGEQLTIIGTVKAHTEDLGAPLTVLSRPRLIEQPAEPQSPAPQPTGEVWEALNPTPAKARPFPGQTHPLAAPAEHPDAL